MANYKIQTGDTFSAIAAKNGTTISNLLRANSGITDANKIQAGSSLILPDPVVPGSVINSQNLNGGSNITVPDPVNNTTSQNMLGVNAGKALAGTPPAYDASTGLITDYGKSLQAPKKPAVNNLDSNDAVLQALRENIGITDTKGDFTLQAQEDADLSGKQAELTRLNNEALTTRRAYDEQIKRLRDTNPEGKFGGGLDIALNDLSRKANEDLANIGILQQVAQNNVEGAQSIVDAKVKAKFEPIENKIASLERLYTLYQNDMSESEKFAATAKINELKDQKDTITDAYQTALKTAVANGAPPSVLSAIDVAAADPKATQATIYAALGGYGKTKDKAATGTKITLSKAKSLGLPASTVGMSEQDIADSFYDTTPPDWFIEKVEKEQNRSLTAAALLPIWNQYRSVMQKNAPSDKVKTSANYTKAFSYFQGAYGLEDSDAQALADRVELYVNGGSSYADAVAKVEEEAQ